MTEMAVPQPTVDGETVVGRQPDIPAADPGARPARQRRRRRRNAPTSSAGSRSSSSSSPAAGSGWSSILIGAVIIGAVVALPLTPIVTILGIVAAIALLAAASTPRRPRPDPRGNEGGAHAGRTARGHARIRA